MALIQLHTDKSVISVPMDVPADAKFIEYHGKHFAIAATSNNRRMWEEFKGEVPDGAKVYVDPNEPKSEDVPEGLRARSPSEAVPKPRNIAEAAAAAVPKEKEAPAVAKPARIEKKATGK